jgi:hypothetical protein
MGLEGKNREFVEQLISKELVFKNCISTWGLAIAATEVAEAYSIHCGVQVEINDPKIKAQWFDFIRFARNSACLEADAVLTMWAEETYKDGPNKEYLRQHNFFEIKLDTSVYYNGEFLGPAILALSSIEEELMAHDLY